MKTVEIVGYKRANLGKSEAKKLRAEGMVPGVLYGGEEQVHFYAPMILFRELVYTDEAHFVNLNIEGDTYEAILQDIQFHPVSEIIMHVDFLQLFRGTKIKMDIPVRPVGTPPGIQQGGKLIRKLRLMTVRALPKDMPEYIEVDVSKLGLGKSVKVGEVPTENFEILNSPLVTIMGIEVPRALRGKQVEDEEGEEEGEEAAAE
ncbi:50S ribosomal protein L25/general stress protein Ctc [Marinoscillum furvescens]|uniref:Large ribosomal subunit protein bL25 n=1 Tax=Marinoscillum furvescens DSM 4134 TaxID=1122208 RepID=A0A3D9L772_MARFU|nr:50S ribosomal protein L25/general stress protein Ctc [Marinoscillum furvescens]REE02198.1 LSU ribosomal protein L25P [Marinoscillum furvescens DSM 4134]